MRLETMMTTIEISELLREKLGSAVRQHVPLARYTSARVGGPADLLVTANSADELAAIVTTLWESGTDFVLLGGGSNVLVGDRGIRGVTILNRAKDVRFDEGEQPKVYAESGVVLSNLANRCALKGLSGLEWAATVPGTIGGAVYGNAGAFGGDMARTLSSADVLSPVGSERWTVDKLGYGYRTSILKRREVRAVILGAELRLEHGDPAEVAAKIAEFSESRKATQPPGASMGSTFRNPPDDYAGRLIEAAGLKGTRIGSAAISTLHANFIITHEQTRAADVRALIQVVKKAVLEKSGVDLELEIELVGE
jgi:UDP-N-acetylmuramate dehydrogenase